MRESIMTIVFACLVTVASAGEAGSGVSDVCDNMFTKHSDAGLTGVDVTSGSEVSFVPTSTETYDSPEACCSACLDDPECLYILAVDGDPVRCYLKKSVDSTYATGAGTQAYFTRNSEGKAAYVVTFPDRGTNYPKGIITLVQTAATGDLAITTSLTGLEGAALGNKWHVHQFPTGDTGGIDDMCGSGVTGGHYNPTFQGVGTPGDQATYEVGDFSGKHGYLGIDATEDAAEYTESVASVLYDQAANSRGSKWIVGRSIVIHKADGSRWACANIGAAGVGVNIELGDEAAGTIELFQANPNVATSVTLTAVAGVSTALAGNKWHVHDFPVPASGSCAADATGGHYDPMQSVPEYGDLSAKHGLLTGTENKHFVDATLPLHGAYSVLGRSIVIHEAASPYNRWACATIPNRLKVRFPPVGGAPSGSMSFYQATVGGAVTITSSLRSLEGTAGGNKWHVHRFPTDAAGGTGDGGCGAAVTAGHYNPTFKAGYTACADQAGCEVGDLSTKHGKLGIGKSTDMATYSDTTLSILYDPSTARGRMWAAGRSIVIHKDDGSRWSCANLGEAGVGVDVVFEGFEVTGAIELFAPKSGYDQFAWAYETKSHFSTSVTVALLGLEASPGNKWHVHVDPVVAAGDCLATGGHFDPLGANYADNAAPPPYEIGDLSGKWGRLNGDTGEFVGSTQGYVLDAELPLVGNNSVLGRSIVIHKVNGDRWVCATTLNNPTYTYPPPPPLPPQSQSPPSPPPSTESVVLTLTASGSVSDYSDDDKSSLQQKVAYAAGVDESLVTISIAAASVRITATIAVPATTTSAAVRKSLSTSLGTADTASAALGITVESDPTIAIETIASDSSFEPNVPMIVGIAAGAFVFVALLSVGAGVIVHRRQQQNKPGRVKRGNTADPEAGYQMNVKDHGDLKINEA